MSNPAANPLGAGGDVAKAAPLIRAILDKREQATAGQPAENAAPVPANPTPGERVRDPVTKRFVKATEPQTAGTPDASKEGTDTPTEPEQPAEQIDPTSDDREELAEDVDGLARQLGMEPDELLDHLKAKVKVRGEEKRVNLKELLSGYSMESDYRLKTAEHAEERRKFQAEFQAYQQQREHLSSQLSPLVQQLESLVSEDDVRLQQLLNDGDILEYERAKFRADQRKAQLTSAKQHQQRIDEQRQNENNARFQEAINENERLLAERFPEWAKEPEKGRKAISEVRQYLKSEGVPAQKADDLIDAVSIHLAHKAMQWDKLQKEKPGKLQEVKKTPVKFQMPGAARAAEDPKKQVLRASLNRLRKTGDVRDAAKAFKAMGLVQR